MSTILIFEVIPSRASSDFGRFPAWRFPFLSAKNTWQEAIVELQARYTFPEICKVTYKLKNNTKVWDGQKINPVDKRLNIHIGEQDNRLFLVRSQSAVLVKVIENADDHLIQSAIQTLFLNTM